MLTQSELIRELEAKNAKWSIRSGKTSSLDTGLGFRPYGGLDTLIEREKRAAARFAAQPIVPGGAAFPQSFDWRTFGKVTPAKDQGDCDSCVAFAACACLESMILINSGKSLSLSEAHLFYCYAEHMGRRCSGPSSGWTPEEALPYIKNFGIVDTACYPYGNDLGCPGLCPDWKSRLTKITDWHSINDPINLKTWISSQGPLIAAFTVFEDFASVGDGVYHYVTGKRVTGHCVCVIGYDETLSCWICKNSQHNAPPFFKIGYGECGIDDEMWAIDGVI